MGQHEAFPAALPGAEPLLHCWHCRVSSATQRNKSRGRDRDGTCTYLWGPAGWRRSASSAWERHSGTGQNRDSGQTRAPTHASVHNSSGHRPAAAFRGCTHQSEDFLIKLYCINLMPAPGLSQTQGLLRLDRQNMCLMGNLYGSQAKQTQCYKKLPFTLKKYC